MAMTLLVEDLQRVADGPHGLDPDVLMAIQRNLVTQVMQMYRDDYVQLDASLEARGASATERRAERSAWLTRMVRNEYRNRARNGEGFSLPMYVEQASNHYKMTIQRLEQSIGDYVEAASDAADLHYTVSDREVRKSEVTVDAMAHQIAGQLDKLDMAMDGLARLSTADATSRDLRQRLSALFEKARQHPFTAAVVEQARTLAEVAGYERRHGLNDVDVAALAAAP